MTVLLGSKVKDELLIIALEMIAAAAITTATKRCRPIKYQLLYDTHYLAS